MLLTGRLYCEFEAVLVNESYTLGVMRDLRYENETVLKLFHFHVKVIIPELFSNNIKAEFKCKDLLEEIVILLEMSEVT